MISNHIIGILVFTALYGGYKLFLESSGNFRVNRFIMLLLPLVAGATVFMSFEQVAAPLTVIKQLPEVRGSAESTINQTLAPDVNWIFVVYLIGAVGMFSAFIYSLIKTLKIERTSSGFSFFGRIIVNDSLPSKEQDLIHKHELVHKKKYHSIDVLFVELMRAVWWFNPLIHAYVKAVKLNHEYEADAEASVTEEQYSELLVSQYLGIDQSLLGHSFSKSNLKKRLIMMNSKKKSSTGKYLSYVAGASLVVLLASWSPARDVTSIIGDAPSTQAPVGEPDSYPEFPGGNEALMKYMMENIKYPQKAANNDVEGKAMVGFIVEADGSISNVSLKNEVHPALEKEAIRVVESMPKWKPAEKDGKAVSAEMVLPIMFKLPAEE